LKSGFINSSGLNIYYESEGVGEPLIVLHGGPGIPHGYLQDVWSLSKYFHLVFFDQRGTGRSEKTNPGEYTIETNVGDIENLRLSLNLGPIILFGHSWGGMLAQAYSLAYPENVTKLVLANTFSSVDQLNAALAKMRASMPDAIQSTYERYEREGLYRNQEHYPIEYQKAVDAAYAPVSLTVPRPEYLEEAFGNMAYDVYRAMWGDETEFKITGTLRGFNFLPRLHEIRVPTLVIVGAQDMTSIEMAEATAKEIPYSRLVVFERSRHYPFIEEKERFHALVRDFLQEPYNRNLRKVI